MSAAATVLADLQGLGVLVGLAGDSLTLDAPAGVLTPAVLARVGAHKPALVTLLAAPLSVDGWVLCPCGRRHYGVAGRPTHCPPCRQTRDGEPVAWWWTTITKGVKDQ